LRWFVSFYLRSRGGTGFTPGCRVLLESALFHRVQHRICYFFNLPDRRSGGSSRCRTPDILRVASVLTLALVV